MIGRWMEITFVLIAVYLVLDNAFGFTQVVQAIGSAYSVMVKTLQARD